MRSFTAIAGTALAAASVVTAQTYTDCDPMNKTCTPDTGLDVWTITTDFRKGASEFALNWTEATGTTLTFDSTKGAVFNMSEEGQAPTVSTDYYIMFGKVEVVMQAAPGTGIVSSVVLESDDLDEIDWEWLGGNNTSVETNYFGKGNTTLYNRAIYYDVDSPTTEMHTYTVDWTAESIVWSIDGVDVRTLLYADADDGYDFPQTPLRVKLGNWCGGCSTESYWTREWAGGNTTWTDAPFVMYVESVTVTNYNPAKSYNWTDTSGSYESIDASNSTTISTNIVASATSSSSGTAESSSASTSVVVSSSVVTTTNSAGQTVTSTSVSSSTATSFSQSTGSSDATTSSAASGRTALVAGSGAGIVMAGVSFLGLAVGAFLL